MSQVANRRAVSVPGFRAARSSLAVPTSFAPVLKSRLRTRQGHGKSCTRPVEMAAQPGMAHALWADASSMLGTSILTRTHVLL